MAISLEPFLCHGILSVFVTLSSGYNAIREKNENMKMSLNMHINGIFLVFV